jgi:hypothetical protein
MLTITIDTDGDAFAPATRGHEIARLLADISSRITGGAVSGTVTDANGEEIGEFNLDDDAAPSGGE